MHGESEDEKGEDDVDEEGIDSPVDDVVLEEEEEAQQLRMMHGLRNHQVGNGEGFDETTSADDGELDDQL